MKNDFEYNILNPGGNKTALVKGNDFTLSQKKIINKIILNQYKDVEQVGFLSNKENRLEMAGDEFCLNAARCAIWEYLKGKKGNIEFTESGTDKLLKGKVLDNNVVEVEVEIGKQINDLIKKKDCFTCIKLDGILIGIIDEKKSKTYIDLLKRNKNSAKLEVKKMIDKNLICKEKAIGVMLLEKQDKKIKINPIVWVKEIDTIYYETACGSGSVGVAIYNFSKNSERKIELIQPSGYSINIEIIGDKNYIEKVIVRGIVEECY